MTLEFSGRVFYWKGPAPWHFVAVPEAESEAVAATSGLVSYGWGMIPATAAIGRTEWATALFRQQELYVVPLKTVVRRAERLEIGDLVAVRLTVAV